MLATERLLRTPGRNRLGELPRACSQLTDYPSRLSKNSRRMLRPALILSSDLRWRPRGTPAEIRADSMELMGIEPTASGLQNRRSPS
jgi:hypothetical protein